MASDNHRLHTITDQDGAAILDIDQGQISTLNPAGAYIWQRLEGGWAIEMIVADIVRETGEVRSVVEADVREFVSSLKENGLLSA